MTGDGRAGRGVRLGDLDRGRRYVLAYTGQRWEVVGPLDAAGSSEPAAGTHPGADAGGASTGAYAPRHAAPAPSGTEEAPAGL